MALCASMTLVPLDGTADAAVAPHTIVTDGQKLAAIKVARDTGKLTSAQLAAMKAVLDKANTALTAGPWSVMDKPTAPPSGNKHDYMSQAPYWWAGPKT